MLEAIMGIIILGMISVGGYSGIRYGLQLSQAWRAQPQIDNLAKDVIDLYAWQDGYGRLSMGGSRGICNTIITPGNQDCEITSPWNQKVSVSKGKSNASFKIVMHKTPKAICEHLSRMNFKYVFMVHKSCALEHQDIEFLMDKDDKSCPDGCPDGYECINGGCRPGDREDACHNVHCVGECLTGACRAGTCLREMDGKSCSIGVCQQGVCVPETTVPETTSPASCDGFIGSDGVCYDCKTPQAVDVNGVQANCAACPDRVLGGYRNTSCTLPCAKGSFMDSGGNCHSCDTPQDVGVTRVEGNCDVCSNRYVEYGPMASYCVLNEETTTTEEPCKSNEIKVDGVCYSCNQFDPIFAWDIEQLYGCSNREIACGTVGTMDCYSYLKDCPAGYKKRSDSVCKPGEIQVYDGQDLGCCYMSKCTGRQPLEDKNQNCYACDTTLDVDVTGVTQNCFDACPLRSLEGNLCKLCPSDKPLISATGKCYACADTRSINVKGVEANCSVCKNRKIDGSYCALTSCPSDTPMMDTQGECHSCDETQALYLYGATQNCAACSAKRQIEADYYCALKTCPAGQFKAFTGACYPCDYPTGIDVYKVNQNCGACSNRQVVNNACVLKTCPSDKPLIAKNGGCYSCAESADYMITAQNCSVCKNNVVSARGYCRPACPAGKPLMDENGNCYECETNSVVSVYGVTGNCAVCKNRILTGSNNTYCAKPCGTNEVMDSMGVCYACDYPYSISMSGVTGNCAKCDNRQLDKTFGTSCILKSCPAGQVLNPSGRCLTCGVDPINVDSASTNCNSYCSGYVLKKIGSFYYCVPPSCPADKPLVSKLGQCFACDYTGSVQVDGVTENCAVCKNRTLKGGNCYLED